MLEAMPPTEASEEMDAPETTTIQSIATIGGNGGEGGYARYAGNSSVVTILREQPDMIPRKRYGNLRDAGRVPVIVRKLKRSTGVILTGQHAR